MDRGSLQTLDPTPRREDGSSDETSDAVIVGAGMAGMAAALRLLGAGLRVVVLEARDRPGGRLLTDHRLGEGLPLELGAQMVHGRTVRTHAWLARAGLSTRPYPTVRRSRLFVQGRVARYPWLFFPFHPVVGTRAAWASVYGVPRALQDYRGPDLSLSAFLDRESVPAAARTLVTLLHAHVYATDPDSIGVRGQAEEDVLLTEAYGFNNFLVREGYDRLVADTSARVGPALRLHSPVRKIERSGSGLVVHVSPDAGGPDRRYLAPAVVVTVPLSILRAEAIEFVPPLPAAKRAAIRRIAFGHAFVVHLRLAESRIRRSLGDFAMAYGLGPSSFYRPRVGLGEGTEYLAAFTVGREAERRQQLTDQEVLDATVQEWEGLTRGKNPLGPVHGATLHRWSGDPYARGAYSYLPPGATLDDRARLATPVNLGLFFAGEATATDGHAATVQGAIATGERAANEVIAARRARPVGTASSGPDAED